MANHYKNNKNKSARTNGARYREKPKKESKLRAGLTNTIESVNVFGKKAKSNTRIKTNEKKYTAKRYQGSAEQKKVFQFPLREDKQTSARYLRRDADEKKPHEIISFNKEIKEEKQPEILRFQKSAGDDVPENKPKRFGLRKKKQTIDPDNLPTSEQLERELKREKNKRDNNRLVRNTIFALITVAATAVLVATLFLPILQIYGTSMKPTLSEGEIVVSIKGSAFERGDIISFYYNNKILVKRVIAFEGEYVNINDDGTVLINNKAIEEPYITEKSFGECDLKLPYQVPAGKIFVLGDHRDTSVDSRSSVMGCVAEEQIVGKIVFRVWPFDRMGEIN